MNKVVRLSVTTSRDHIVLYFTPVTRGLPAMAGRLNALLHAQIYRADDDRWWSTQRQFLERVYQELKIATAGTLLGPPLLQLLDSPDHFLHISSEH